MKFSAKDTARLRHIVSKNKSKKEAASIVRAFIGMVQKKAFGAAMPAVQAMLNSSVKHASKVSVIKIETARELSEKELADVCRTLGIGDGVDLQVCVEPAHIAGIKIIKGDTVIDATVRAKLERLKSLFA